MPEFLSPEAFDFAWTQYQTLLVDKLNLLTQGELTTPALRDDPAVQYWPQLPWFTNQTSPVSQC